jgi:prefoldin subunit 5
MQTLQQQLIALNKRAHAASDAIKLIESLKPKIEVKNAEIAALQAGLATCPEGRSKAGLTKRIETLQKNVAKLEESLATTTAKAGIILDLSTPYNPAPATADESKPDTEGDHAGDADRDEEQPPAAGTEGGDSPQE